MVLLLLVLACPYLLLEVITLWELGQHQRRWNCFGALVSNVLLQCRRAVWEHCAELAEELFVLTSVLLFWLWRNQLLKRKVGNVLKWVMFVLWLSNCIHNWFSSSIQLVRSFPCSTWHREPLYSCRQHASHWLVTLEINRYFSCWCRGFWCLQEHRTGLKHTRNSQPFIWRPRCIYILCLFLNKNWKILLTTNKTIWSVNLSSAKTENVNV